MLEDIGLKGMPEGWRVRFGRCDESEWDRIALAFDDLVLYQTWQYGAVRWGERNLAHLVATRDGREVGAAQVRLTRLPLAKAGAAYAAWAPLWRPRGAPRDVESYRLVLRGLREACAGRLGLCLCVRPQDREDGGEGLPRMLGEEGYRPRKSQETYETVELDLARPLEDIRKAANRTWRQQLSRGERNGLEVAEGTDAAFYDAFLSLYAEMKERKQFVSFVDAREFRAIQERLPEALKMRVVLCRLGGEPVSALVYSALGDKAVGILAATSARGRELRAGHVMWWHAVERLHERGFRSLDMGGMDAARAPGPAQFKLGLAGGGGVARHVGQFEAPGSALSRLGLAAGSSLVSAWRRMRRAGADARRAPDAPSPAAQGQALRKEAVRDRPHKG